MLQEDTTGRIICDIVNMKSSSVLYSMSLTLSIFKVTRRLLQLQNQTTCMVDHPGLEPVFECVLTTECIQHLQGRLWAFTSKRNRAVRLFFFYQSFLQYKYDCRIKYNKLLFPQSLPRGGGG